MASMVSRVSAGNHGNDGHDFPPAVRSKRGRSSHAGGQKEQAEAVLFRHATPNESTTMNTKTNRRMREGGLYATPGGMVGSACRHPLHGAGGSLSYIETAGGDLYAVHPDRMREATATERRRWKREAAGHE